MYRGHAGRITHLRSDMYITPEHLKQLALTSLAIGFICGVVVTLIVQRVPVVLS